PPAPGVDDGGVRQADAAGHRLTGAGGADGGPAVELQAGVDPEAVAPQLRLDRPTLERGELALHPVLELVEVEPDRRDLLGGDDAEGRTLVGGLDGAVVDGGVGGEGDLE